MLAKLSDELEKWNQVIHLAEFAINNTMFRSTGSTLSQLLFGLEQLGQINDSLRLTLCDDAATNRDLPTLRQQAAQKIEVNQSANEKSFNRTHKEATVYDEMNMLM